MRKMGFRSISVAVLLALAMGCAAHAEELVLPVPSKMADATFDDADVEDDGSFTLYYAGATEDDVDFLKKILNFYGYGVSREITDEQGLRFCLAYNLVTDAMVYIAYSEETESLQIYGWDDFLIAEDEDISETIDYYTQDLTLPSSAGSYIFPQFYASTGAVSAYYTGLTWMSGLPFECDACWTERYDEVEPSQIQRYLSDMLLCGFDIEMRFVEGDDGSFSYMIYDFSMGEAQLMLTYDIESGNAGLYYKPDVSYYLLSGAEYDDTIPQK